MKQTNNLDQTKFCKLYLHKIPSRDKFVKKLILSEMAREEKKYFFQLGNVKPYFIRSSSEISSIYEITPREVSLE